MMFRKKSTYIFIVLITILLLTFKPCRDFCYKVSADFFYPFFSFQVRIRNSIEKREISSKSKSELVSQVLDMQKKIVLLENKSEYLQNFKGENDRLRQLLNVRQIPDFKYLIAEIIYRDPIKWYTQFTVDKGTDNGIENGAIVLGSVKGLDQGRIQFGVIGRIGLVSKHTAVVYTILSNECQLSVMIPSYGATGILHGGGRQGGKTWANIYFLPKDFEYKEKSLVITSGLTSLAPKGLTIGALIGNTDDTPNDNKLFARASVAPAIDLNHLDFVLILGKNND